MKKKEIQSEMDTLLEEIRLDYSVANTYGAPKRVAEFVRSSCECMKENIERLLTLCDELEQYAR